MSKRKIDVSTLTGWTALSGGTHTITLKAKASGYETSDASSSVSVTKTITYTVTATATNATINGSTTYSGTIASGGTLTLTLGADGTSYKLPTTITVSGATGTYSRTSDTVGTLTISNPTTNVTFSVEGESAELTELCFTANTAGSTVELYKVGTPKIRNTAYSTDRVTWTSFTPSATTGTNTITLTNVGDKVYFRGNMYGNCETSNSARFNMTGSIAASGNINSLYTATGFNELTTLTYQYCFCYLFYNCTSLTAAPELPATTLSNYCYSTIFYNCTNLVTGPSTLPATTLAQACYQNMFFGCTSLVNTVDSLPATTAATYCYYCMYQNCTSLKKSPKIYLSSSTTYCCYSMFYGCTSLDTVSELLSTKLAYGCYNNMFYNCTSLYVSDTSGTGYDKAWNIPSNGTFTNTTTYNQTNIFISCLGTRSSTDMSGALGDSHTYYTQNTPV